MSVQNFFRQNVSKWEVTPAYSVILMSVSNLFDVAIVSRFLNWFKTHHTQNVIHTSSTSQSSQSMLIDNYRNLSNMFPLNEILFIVTFRYFFCSFQNFTTQFIHFILFTSIFNKLVAFFSFIESRFRSLVFKFHPFHFKLKLKCKLNFDDKTTVSSLKNAAALLLNVQSITSADERTRI
jgi:hypothetical protein